MAHMTVFSKETIIKNNRINFDTWRKEKEDINNLKYLGDSKVFIINRCKVEYNNTYHFYGK